MRAIFADSTSPVLSSLQASGVSASSAIISWTSSEPTDSQVEYGLDTTYGQQTALDSSLATSHSQELTGLAANTTYHYRVLSKDAAGNLALSADQSFTTTALPPPVAPVELRATASSSSSIELSWRDQADDELGFVIERASGAGIFTGIDSTTAEVSTYRDNGLSSGTNYRYRVLAYNANGNSGYSNLATATTYKTFTLTVSGVGNGSVALDPPGGVYDSSTVVRLTATAEAGWRFSGWSGAVTGNSNPLQVGLSSDLALTAHFSQDNRVTDGLLALYRFTEGGGHTVNDVSDVGTPLDLRIADTSRVRWLAEGGLYFADDSALVTSEGPARKLYDGLTSSEALTVEVWAMPEHLEQTGPARIVSYSSDNSLRNFTLGQQNDGAVMRIRTPRSGLNGAYPDLEIAGVLGTGLHHIVSTQDGEMTRMYIDGELQSGSLDLAADFSNWDPGYGLVLGNEAIASRPWRGNLYLVAIYDRALTQEQIQQNLDSGMQTELWGSKIVRKSNSAQVGALVLPEQFELFQNYPNPFNGGTLIRFEVPSQTQVKISIVDINGRVVAQLADSVFAAGKHEIHFEPDQLASGIYFYVMEAGRFRDMRRMLYLK